MITSDLARALIGLPPDPDGALDDFDGRVLVGLWWSETEAAAASSPSARPSLRVARIPLESLIRLTVGRRSESVRFDVLGPAGEVRGEVRPVRDQAPTITNDTSRTTKRTLDGLWIAWDEAEDLDTLEDRIRPSWVFENGDEFPLGIFLFASAPRPRHTRGVDLKATLIDQGIDLDQPDGPPVSYPIGTNVGAALALEWAGAGYSDAEVDATTVALAGPIGWPPGTTRVKRMSDLGTLAGFLTPYFTNAGVPRSRTAPVLALEQAAFLYGLGEGATPVDRDTIVEDDDRLQAPNRYIVIGGSSTDAPVFAVYDLPASVPWAEPNIGRFRAVSQTIQGVPDNTTALAIAQAWAAQDPALLTRVDYDAPPDPRHDTWDLVEYDPDGSSGLTYLETSWGLVCQPGGPMHHSDRRSLLDG